MAKFTQSPKIGEKFRKALIFAFDHHRFQIRKSEIDGVPYFSHLMAVSSLVLEQGGSEEEAIVALLHDTIEDIGLSKKFLVQHFGSEISEMVDQLSAGSNDEYILKISEASDTVKFISAADKLHNLRCYASPNGYRFWKSDHAQFYLRLLEIYKNCGRVPKRWVHDMGVMLLALPQ